MDLMRLDLRRLGSAAIFAMAKMFAEMLREQKSLTITLVIGEKVEPADTIRLCENLVEQAVYHHHRAMAESLYILYIEKVPTTGQRHQTFSEKYPEEDREEA